MFGQIDERAPFTDYLLRLANRAHEANMLVDIVTGPYCDPPLKHELGYERPSVTCVPLEKPWSVMFFATQVWTHHARVVHWHLDSPNFLIRPIARLMGARGFVHVSSDRSGAAGIAFDKCTTEQRTGWRKAANLVRAWRDRASWPRGWSCARLSRQR